MTQDITDSIETQLIGPGGMFEVVEEDVLPTQRSRSGRQRQDEQQDHGGCRSTQRAISARRSVTTASVVPKRSTRPSSLPASRS